MSYIREVSKKLARSFSGKAHESWYQYSESWNIPKPQGYLSIYYYTDKEDCNRIIKRVYSMSLNDKITKIKYVLDLCTPRNMSAYGIIKSTIEYRAKQNCVFSFDELRNVIPNGTCFILPSNCKDNDSLLDQQHLLKDLFDETDSRCVIIVPKYDDKRDGLEVFNYGCKE